MSESTGKLLRDYSIAVALAVLLALFIRGFVIEAYRIPSSAMKPTLEAGDTIFVSKSAYGYRLPKWISDSQKHLTGPKIPLAGDVVIFSPGDDPGRDFIKRVIGLPGDLVEMRKGLVLVNEAPLKNTAVGDTACGTETLIGPPPARALRNYPVCFEPPQVEELPPTRVPADSLFVVGDLRSAATEQGKQKNWRMIRISELKGKALWVWLSIEPGSFGDSGFFPRIRFERMFRRIE